MIFSRQREKRTQQPTRGDKRNVPKDTFSSFKAGEEPARLVSLARERPSPLMMHPIWLAQARPRRTDGRPCCGRRLPTG